MPWGARTVSPTVAAARLPVPLVVLSSSAGAMLRRLFQGSTSAPASRHAASTASRRGAAVRRIRAATPVTRAFARARLPTWPAKRPRPPAPQGNPPPPPPPRGGGGVVGPPPGGGARRDRPRHV